MGKLPRSQRLQAPLHISEPLLDQLGFKAYPFDAKAVGLFFILGALIYKSFMNKFLVPLHAFVHFPALICQAVGDHFPVLQGSASVERPL